MTEPLRIAETDDEIRACFPAISALRPHLAEEEFVRRVREQQRDGYRLAYYAEDGSVHCVAGFRIHGFLAWGKVLYIDDLVTAPEARRRGSAGKLMEAIAAHAREQGCDQVHLDSGHQRFDAHRFYLNHGFRITAHHFAREVD